MSLLTLLADFPNYSARKVRRLAKQIAMVQGLQKVADVGEETGILKGIESDLMEFNLLQAKTEAQLNDDVQKPVEAGDVMTTSRISVTPTEAARKALDEMIQWVRINSDVTVNADGFEKLKSRCHGIINGQSFYTDRTIIQARLSPQGDLPLDHAQAGEPA